MFHREKYTTQTMKRLQRATAISERLLSARRALKPLEARACELKFRPVCISRFTGAEIAELAATHYDFVRSSLEQQATV